MFATTLYIRRQFVQIIGHLLDGHGKLEAMFSCTIIYAIDLLVASTIGALTVFGANRSLIGGSRQFSQALRMFLFDRSSLLEEC